MFSPGQVAVQLPRYKCHKEVWAVKILQCKYEQLPKFTKATCRGSLVFNSNCGHCERCEWEKTHPGPMKMFIIPADQGYGPIEVDAAYIDKHKPQPGGYYVVYADGYKSFSPAQAFEEGYTRT